jgi:hypothetical protein
MSKKARKDKRNREKESGHWKPAKWTLETVERKLRRAFRKCEEELGEFLGPHEGRIVAAGLRSERKEIESVSALRARGVKLLGDVETASEA